MKRSVRFAIVAAAAALSIGVVAGCGGSSSASSSEAASSTSADIAMTKEQFVAQANAICAQGTAKYKALGDQRSFSSRDEMVKYFASVSDLSAQQGDAIAALPAPADIAPAVSTYLEMIRRNQAIVKDFITRITNGEDFATVKAETLNSDAMAADITARRRAATEAGLTECATS